MAALQQRLGYTFQNPALLQQACTHSEDRSMPSYKELGFVGDAVLWALFAEHAFHCSTDTPRR
jgi:ribonuclease-3